MVKKIKNIVMIVAVFSVGFVSGGVNKNEGNVNAMQEKEIQKVIEYVEVLVEVEKEVPVEVVKEVPVEIVKEVEVVKEIPVVKEIEVVKEVPVEIVEEVEDKKEIKDEQTIYNMFDIDDEEYVLPLKATIFSLNDNSYTVLSDGYGSLYIVDVALKNGENYVGKIDGTTNTLVEYKESDFKFTYEDYFEEYRQDEIDWAIEQLEVDF